MEYDGFIHSIINRGDEIIYPEKSSFRPKDRKVTRLLLILQTGFALVYERISFVEKENEDLNINYKSDFEHLNINSKTDLFKKIKKQNIDQPLLLRDQIYFEDFVSKTQWTQFLVKTEDVRRHKISELIKQIGEHNIVKKEETSYYDLMQCMRNSLAHGGVHPLSPRLSLNRANEFGSLDSDSLLDRVYLVSDKREKDEITGKNQITGKYVLEMSTDSLEKFWRDWKNLILKQGSNYIKKLDERVVNLNNYVA